MNRQDPSFYFFRTHDQAKRAIAALIGSGFDLKQLSVIGKGCHPDEKPIGFFEMDELTKSWSGFGTFWGGIWGLMLAPAAFVLSGLGLVAVAGPAFATLSAELERLNANGSRSTTADALSRIGIAPALVNRLESALHADQYAVVVHGDTGRQAMARSVIADYALDQSMSAT